MTPMPNAPNPNAIFGESLARTPAPLPLSTVQEQMAQTAGLNAQVPIQQQTAQELALKNQLTQRTIRNLQIMHDNAPALLQASGGKWDDSVRNGLISKGMDADEVERVSNQHFVNDQTLANTSHIRAEAEKAALENQDHKASIAAKIAVGMQQAVKPDGSLDLPLIQAQIQTIKAQNPDYDGSGLLALASRDPETFKATMGAALKRAPDVAQAEEDVAKAHAQTVLIGAQAQTAAAEARKVSAEAGMTERELELMKQAGSSPGGMTAAVDQLIDPKKYPDINARTKSEFPIAMMMGGPKAAQQVLANAVTHINTLEEGISKATNPQIIQADIDKEIRARVGTQRALAGTGPFSSIIDQGERNRAIEDSTKIDNDYADKVGASRQLRDFVAAAQSGNKAAPGLIPMAEVRQLVNRVTGQELRSVSSSAGSAWDRIQGKIGSLVEGQPIPPDVLRDINTISGTMENAAGRTYDLKRQALGRNHGIAPPPRITVPEAAIPAPAALPQGGGKVIDRATAQQFYEAAGNDPARARQLATSNGWKLQ